MPTRSDIEDDFKELGFPFAGIDISVPFESQRPRVMPNKQYGRTCREAINVRAYEPATDR
jgi:hypothetical protein